MNCMHDMWNFGDLMGGSNNHATVGYPMDFKCPMRVLISHALCS